MKKRGKEGKGKEKKEKQKCSIGLAIDFPKAERFSTGILSFDKALNGGLVWGSLVELFGEESEGKTTIGLQFLAQAQKEGAKVMLLDMEHAIDTSYVEKFLDLSKLYLEQPLSIEECFAKIHEFYNLFPDDYKIILVDSVAAFSTDAQISEDDFIAGHTTGHGSRQKGAVASYMSSPEGVKSILRRPDWRKTITIFVNQTRDKVEFGGGFPGKKPAVSTKYTTGGNALKFYAGFRISIKSIGFITEGGGDDSKEEAANKIKIGKKVRMIIVKNKYGAPYVPVFLHLYYGTGFSALDDLISIGLEAGIITQTGAWFEYSGRKCQGRMDLLSCLKDDVVLLDNLSKECAAFLNDVELEQIPEEEKKDVDEE